jgi:hypothetical protein
MDEIEQTSVTQEIATPETSQQEVQEVAQPPVEDRQERNWRELRRAKDELERKVRMQEELLASVVAQKNYQQQAAPEVDELANIPADDYIAKGQVEKLVQREVKKAEKLAHEAVEKALQEREKSQFMQRLKAKFSDFDDVVNPETLDLLEQQDPELAQTIANVKDPYTIGLQSYKYIKSMGIVDKAPQARRAKEVEKKLEQNAKTVQSPQAFDKRPMAQTFKQTEAQRRDLYEEMMGYARQSGGGY